MIVDSVVAVSWSNNGASVVIGTSKSAEHSSIGTCAVQDHEYPPNVLYINDRNKHMRIGAVYWSVTTHK